MILLAGLLYAAIGVGTAALSGMASSPAGVRAWRYAAWLLSGSVFLWHIMAARPRRGNFVGAAAQVALGVALGALLLAALGPVRAHWGGANRGRLVLLSIVLWPLLTGLPAFLVALGAEYLIGRMSDESTVDRQ